MRRSSWGRSSRDGGQDRWRGSRWHRRRNRRWYCTEGISWQRSSNQGIGWNKWVRSRQVGDIKVWRNGGSSGFCCVDRRSRLEIIAALATKASIRLHLCTTTGADCHHRQRGITGFALHRPVRVLMIAIGTNNHGSFWLTAERWNAFGGIWRRVLRKEYSPAPLSCEASPSTSG